ncbi:MAG TPA: hypothetical protein PLX89_24290 [Verrucomicrobiota bacterium]|nr:hypothetical protein [Verrucomicrobiota bacterium]
MTHVVLAVDDAEAKKTRAGLTTDTRWYSVWAQYSGRRGDSVAVRV